MRRKIPFILVLLMLAFIWGQSCLPAAASRKESLGLLKLLRPCLEFFFGKGNVTHYFVRKLAHFCEFFLLGCFLSALFPLTWRMRIPALGLALLTGFLDETIQIFSGRGDQISDVWLDFSGAAAGILLSSLLFLLLRRRRRHREDPALR